MLTIKDLFEKYGDVPLNEDVMKLFGINEPKEVDCMLRLKDVQKILRIKTASQIIKRLKYKYETPKLFSGFHKKTREAEL